MSILLTGATGLTGSLLLKKLIKSTSGNEFLCLVRPTSDRNLIESLDVNIRYFQGDCSSAKTWQQLLSSHNPETIIHIASINYMSTILDGLNEAHQYPRLIVIGSTGVYSKYRQASQLKKMMETHLAQYPGSWCLLRPTMIYGSPRDKNLHRLIQFCDRYGFFPVFGSGSNLLQPIHADDLAQALFAVSQNPEVKGSYDLSGGSVVTFRELLNLIGKLLGKPIRQISIPLDLGVWSATLLEKILKGRSPVRREQILRLQEDKAYSHEAAQQDFGFSPRSLEVGLQEEIELMREQGLISR